MSASSNSPKSDDGPQFERKRPLPKYTSIDLENELPEMFNSSLNPRLHDREMQMYANRPFYTYPKRMSPPPTYTPKTCTTQTSVESTKSTKSVRTANRYRAWGISALVVFLAIPILILLIYFLIPIYSRTHSY